MEKTLEEYIEKNKDLLIIRYKDTKEEDFVLIRTRNPENHKQIIESNFHKHQYERFKKDSKRFGFTIEELAFIAIMFALDASEKISGEEKKNIRSFIDRQMSKINKRINKEEV